MLRIGICDDSADARIALKAALERALDRRKGEGAFFEFSSGEGLLRWLEKHAGELDMAFLDIEMGELDGMETARRLRAVFDGYSVGALGYLMKPPKPERLDEVLDRGLEACLRDGEKMFLCRSGETVYRIPRRSIRYFVSDRRQVSYVAAARTYTFYGRLDEVERAVGEGFVRIHQRYLVRSAAVDRLEGNQVFVGEEALPVSRACRSAALAALARTALEG